MNEDLIVIHLPLWVQAVGSVGCFWLLWKLVTFSDTAIPDCGWCGHQDFDKSQDRDTLPPRNAKPSYGEEL